MDLGSALLGHGGMWDGVVSFDYCNVCCGCVGAPITFICTGCLIKGMGGGRGKLSCSTWRAS